MNKSLHSRIIQTGRFLNRITLTISDVVLQNLLYPTLLAIAGGAGIWTMVNPTNLKLLADNKVSKAGRYEALLYIWVMAVLIGIAYLAFYYLKKKRDGRAPGRRDMKPLDWGLSFLLALPLFGILWTPKLTFKEPIFAMIALLGAALAMLPSLLLLTKGITGQLTAHPPNLSRLGVAEKPLRFVVRYLPELVVFLVFAYYCLHFSELTINHLQALKVRTTDMTIYTNILYHSLHGDFLGCSLLKTGNHAAAHFDPILLLFVPLFSLFPRPELLLVTQTVWLALGIFAAYLLGNRVLDNKWGGVAVAVSYAFHPCLHSVNLFEFHSLALIASPMLWSIYLIHAGHFRRYFAVFLLTLLIREDVSLIMCFVGLWVILTKREVAWVGGVTIGVSLIYFVLIKAFFMSSSDVILAGKNSYNYIGYFRYMLPHREGLSGLIISLLTNPVYALKYMISIQKLDFAFKLLGPLLFLPLLARQGRVLLLYSVIFILLSSRRAVFSNNYHYQIVALPFLVALVPFGLKRLLESPKLTAVRIPVLPSLLTVLVVSVTLSGVLNGALMNVESHRRYVHTLTSRQQRFYKKMEAFLGLISPEASVTASYSIAPFAAIRTHIYSMNHFHPKTPTDYLFLDRGNTSQKNFMAKFDKQVEEGYYKQYKRYGRLELYKRAVPKDTKFRKPPKAKNKSIRHRRKKRKSRN